MKPIYNPPNLRCTIPVRDWSALHAPISKGPGIAEVIARLDAEGRGHAPIDGEPPLNGRHKASPATP